MGKTTESITYGPSRLTVVSGQLKEFQLTLNKTQRKLNLLCSWLQLKFGEDISFPRSLSHDDIIPDIKLEPIGADEEYQDDMMDVIPNAETEPEEILPYSVQANSPLQEGFDEFEDSTMEDADSILPEIPTIPSPRPSPGHGPKIRKNTETEMSKGNDTSTLEKPTQKKKKVDRVIITAPPVPGVVSGSLKMANFNVPPVATTSRTTTTRFVRIVPRVGEEEEDADGRGKKRVLKLAEVLPQLKSRNLVLVPANQMHKLTKSSVSNSSIRRKQPTVLMPPKNPPCITIDDDDTQEDVPLSIILNARKDVKQTICPKCNVGVSKPYLHRHMRLFCKASTTEDFPSVTGDGDAEAEGSPVAPNVDLSSQDGCRMENILKISQTTKSSSLSLLPTGTPVPARKYRPGPKSKTMFKSPSAQPQDSPSVPIRPSSSPTTSFKCKFCRSCFHQKRWLKMHVQRFHPKETGASKVKEKL